MDTNLDQKDFYELSYYTLSHKEPGFIHQHVVDAYSAQMADQSTKPIRIIFALVGLYLYKERNFTGKQVQDFHVLMSENKMTWPSITLPIDKGAIFVSDVLAIPEGEERDEMIYRWCSSVWSIYRVHRDTIVDLISQYEKK